MTRAFLWFLGGGCGVVKIDPGHDAGAGGRCHSCAQGGQYHQGRPPPCVIRAPGHVFVLQSCQNLEALEGTQGPINEAAGEAQVSEMQKRGRNAEQGREKGWTAACLRSPTMVGATAPEQPAVEPRSPVSVCVVCVWFYVWF